MRFPDSDCEYWKKNIIYFSYRAFTCTLGTQHNVEPTIPVGDQRCHIHQSLGLANLPYFRNCVQACGAFSSITSCLLYRRLLKGHFI